MPYFFCRLTSPRPSFAADMTAEEQTLMAEHGAYWIPRLESGDAIVFGFVADPAGGWGTCIVDVPDESTARELAAGDPVIRRGEGFHYDVFAMPNAIAAVVSSGES
ncbi:MAG TPA: YciI family protein [Thermoleophilaceae bacterium]|jgi:hypothetical protein